MISKKSYLFLIFSLITVIISLSIMLYCKQLEFHEMDQEFSEYFKKNEILISLKPLSFRIYASYLQGCVTEKIQQIGKNNGSFEYCDKKAKEHLNEILGIIL